MAYQSVFRAGLFDGKVAIVTGGGSGIGRCICHELASLGATVVLSSRDSEKLKRVQAEIQNAEGSVDHFVCDIRKEAEVEALIRTVVERHGRVDFLVNNGGGQFAAPLEMISPKGWRTVVETNLTGTFLMSREVLMRTMKENGGAIVNIVADMWRGMPMMGHSGAARAGVVNLTKTAALEWAQYGVRVNAVAPGIIHSSGFDTYPDAVRQALRSLPPELPAKRFGTESEVSAAVVFLLSPGAAYISGETVRVDHASSLYRHAFGIPDHQGVPEFHAFPLGRGSHLPD